MFPSGLKAAALKTLAAEDSASAFSRTGSLGVPISLTSHRQIAPSLDVEARLRPSELKARERMLPVCFFGGVIGRNESFQKTIVPSSAPVMMTRPSFRETM